MPEIQAVSPPSQDKNYLPSLATSNPRGGGLKFILKLIALFLLISICISALNYFDLIPLSANIPFVNLLPKQQKIINILNLKGWDDININRLPNGSIQANNTNASELLIMNKASYVNIEKGGFNIFVKMNCQSNTNKGSPGTAAIALVRDDPLIISPFLVIGLDLKNHLIANYFNLDKDRNRRETILVPIPNALIVSSSSLRIEVKRNSTNQEEWNFYDPQTNTLLAGHIKLPSPFLEKKPTKIYFGLFPKSDVINGGAIQTVSEMNLLKND